MPQNQVVGAGKLFFGAFPGDAYTDSIALRYLGNTPEFSISQSLQTLDHYNADSGLRKKNISIVTQQDMTATFTCDDISPENLALWFQGSKVDWAQDAASAQTTTVLVRRGNYVQLGVTPNLPGGARGVSNVAVVAASAGNKAAGTLTFGAQPSAGDTVTINGSVITFVASGPAGSQVLIGAAATDTAANLRTYINARPALGVTAGGSTTSVALTAITGGTAGNSITLAKSGSVPTLSGATLTGGTAGSAVAATGNYVLDSDAGMIFIQENAPNIADGDTLTITFDQPARTKSLVIAQSDVAFGRLFYKADNGHGSNKDYTFPHVKLTPNGDHNVKTDNAWVTLGFSVEVLAPPLGPIAIIG